MITGERPVLIDVGAEAPDDAAVLRSGAADRRHNRLEIRRGKNRWQRVDERLHAGARGVGVAKSAAFALLVRDASG